MAPAFFHNALAGESKSGKYVSLNVGAGVLSDADYQYPGSLYMVGSDAGAVFSGSLGYRHKNIRYEGELSYQKYDYSEVSLGFLRLSSVGGEVVFTSLLLNCYYDFTNKTDFTPFIGAGIGGSHIETSNSFGPSSGDDDTVFSFQIGAGVAYDMDETVSLELKYRYFRPSEPDFGIGSVEYSGHNILFGIRFFF